MSNPSYNPYAPGNQNSNQGQYELSNTQAQRDSQRAFLGPASSSSSSVASAVIPQNVGESETSRAIRDEYTNTTGMHMLGATEGERPPSTPVHQPLDQGTTVTSTQKDEFRSPCIEMVSCPMTSASLGHKHGVDFESDSSSLNWLSADGSILKSSSALSNYASIADGRSNNPDEEEHNMQTLPGLGDCDLLTSDKPAAAADPRKPRFTPETATKILLHFGLEQQDLEFLITCPEDQMTLANLPLILHQIRQQKDKSEATQVESKPCLETQPAQIVSGVDSYSLSTSGGAVMHEKKVGLGHEAGMKSNRDNSRGSGTVFPIDDADNCQEPLQKKAPEIKRSEQASSLTSLGSSCSSTSPKKTTQSQMLPNQTFQNTLSSFSLSKKDTDMRAPKPVLLNQQEVDCQSTLKTKLPPCESQGLHPSRPGPVPIGSNEPNQTFQDTFSSFPLLKKDTDVRVSKSEAPKPVPLNPQEVACQSTLKTKLPPSWSHGIHPSRPGLVLINISEPNQSFQDTFSSFPLPKKDTDVRVSKSEAPKPVPLNQPEVDRQSTLETKLPPSQSQGIHPSPPGTVLIGGSDTSDTNEESKSKGKRSGAVTSIVGQKGKKTKQMQSKLQCKVAQSKQLIQKQPVEQTQEQPVQQRQPKKKTGQLQKLPVSEPGRAWTPGDFEKSVPLTGVIPGQTNVPTFKDKVAISKNQPTTETLYDCAVATPKIFPHTCSLCNKEYTDLKDWISHKFSIQHQRNSGKLLRKQPVISGAVDKPSTSTSANKTRRRSRSSSKSISPRRQSSPEGKRSRPRSRSQSPQRSRFHCRYSPSSPTRSSERQTRSPKRRSQSPKRRSRSPKRRSRSPKRQSRSPKRRSQSPKRRSQSPKRRSRSPKRQSRSPKRRSQSPKRRSRSPKRQSRSPKRRSRSPKRRSRSPKRQSRSPKRRSQSPKRRSQSPKRRSQSPKRRSRSSERRSRSPKRRSQSPKRRSRSSERRSRSSERRSSKRKCDRLSPPRKHHDRQSPLRKRNETRLPSSKADDRRSPPWWNNKTQSPKRRSNERPSSPRRVANRKFSPRKKYSPSWRSYDRCSPSWRVGETLSPARKSDGSRSPRSQERRPHRERSSPQRKGSNSYENLAKKILETSAVKSLSDPTDLDSVVKFLAPALLAELAKMTPSTSPSRGGNPSSPSRGGNPSSPSSCRKASCSPDLEAKQETSLEFKTTSPETQPDTGDSKDEPVPEKSDVISTKDSGVGLKDTDANRTVSEPERGPSITEKLPASQAKTPKPKSQDDKLAESAADEGAPSRCVPSESQPAENTAESVKASPPTVVKLQGIDKSLSHRDVLTAAEHFGKTKSLVLIRARSEAIVIFETGEDAKKLKMAESLDVNGRTISVIVEKETVSKEKTPPQKKQASKPEASIEEILPSSPAMPKSVPTEGGVLVSDATRVSAQQAVKTGTLSAKGEVKTEEEEQEISLRSKNHPDAGDSSQRPAHEKSKSVVKDLVVGLTDEPIAPEAASMTQKPKTSSKAVGKETMNMTGSSKVKASENLPKTGAPKEKPTSENSATKGGGVKLVNTEVSDKSANKAARSMSKEEVDSASKGETGSTGKKAKPRVDKPAEPGAEEDASAPSRSADSQSQTHGQSVMVNQSEIKIHKSLEVPEDPTKTAEKEHVSVSKPEDPGKLVKKDDAREPVELEVSGGEVTEPVEVGICVLGKVEETTSSESAPDNPRDDQPPTGSVQNHPIETSVKASTQVKESPQSEPEFTTRGPKTRTEALQEQQQVVPSTSAHPQNQPQDVELGKNDINIQESLEVPKDTAKEAVKEAVIGLKHMGQEQVDEAHDAEEPMDLGVSGAKVAEGKEGEITPEAAPVNSRPQTDETQPTETSIKASTQVQQSLSSEPESSAQGPETRTEQQQAVMPGGVATQQGVVKVSSKVTISPVNKEPTAAAKSVQKPAVCKKPPIVPRVTVGELLHERLHPHHIRCLKPHFLTDSRRLPYGLKNVLVFGLPIYCDCAYSESEVSNLLFPFGFGMDSLYVVPQSRMAFVEMPSEGTLLYLMREAAYKGVFFRGQRLRFAVIAFGGPFKPLRFYRFLKKVLNCLGLATRRLLLLSSLLVDLTKEEFCQFDDAERTVFITDISPRQIRELREALKKFAPVRNFTPLLNKVFVEFHLVEDTERFGLWHSQQKQPLGQTVIRLSGQFINRPVLAVATQSGAASASKTPANVSAVEKVPTMQTPGISEQERLAAATVTKDRVAGKETAGPSKSEAPQKKPGAGVPKTKAIPDEPVTGVKGPQNQTAQIQKSENRIKSELAKIPLVDANVLASKEGTVPTIQKAEKSEENQDETGAASRERTAKEPLENQTDAGESKLKPGPDRSDVSVKEPGVGLVETSKVDEPKNRTQSEVGDAPLVGQRVVAFKKESVSTTQKPETPSGKLALTEAIPNERTVQDVAEDVENLPGAGDPKLNPEPDKSVTNDKELQVGLKENTNADMSENRTELANGSLVEAKVLASIEEKVLTTKKPETPKEELPAKETVTFEKISQTKPGLGDSKEDDHQSAQITNTAPVKGPLIGEKVFVSKAETETIQKHKTPPETPPAAEDVTVPSTSEASENLPDTIDTIKGAEVELLKDTEEAKSPSSEEQVFAPKAETLSTKQEPKTQVETFKVKQDEVEIHKSLDLPKEKENVPVFERMGQEQTDEAHDAEEPMDLGVSGAKVAEGKEGETTPEAAPVNSRPQTVETQPTETSIKASTQVQQSLSSEPESSAQGPETRTARVIKKENVPVVEHVGQEELVKAHDAEEPKDLGLAGAKAGENRGEETSSEFSPVKSTDKPKDSRPQTVESQQTEISVEALTQVRESPLSEPESSARGPETRTEAPQDTQQQAAGRTQEAAVEAVMPGAETKTSQHEVLTKETTTMDSTSTKEIPCEPTAAASVTQPTIGEMLDKHLFPDCIRCVSTAKLLPSRTLLAISGLPTLHERSYTEDDVADLLAPYHFHDKENNLYVIPQAGMAFATMPNTENVINVMRDYAKKGISFRGKGLHVQIVHKRCPFDQFEFYSLLKKIIKCSAADDDDEERIVFIRNISPSEIRELRETLKEFGPVTNFMPLLNKLFIELPSIRETERFAEWYGLLNHAAGHKVFWTKRRGYQRHSGPAATLTTQRDAASDQDSSVTPEKTRVKRPTEEDLANHARLTFGERFEKQLTRSLIGASLMRHPGTSPKMLISWHNDDHVSYAEDDFIRLLAPFGYQHRDHNIYVAPQACLAFVLMPTARSVLDVIRASKGVPIILKGCELFFYTLNNNISMNPTWFYKSLMELLKYRVDEHSNRLILIKDISPSDTRELREVLTKGRSVRNFLPLLNKVFIEFHTPSDADQLGVWYSLLKTPPAYRLQRLKIPYSRDTAKFPIAPMSLLLGSEDLIDGVTVPSAKVSVPQFSIPPFWITLRKGPFVFPTVSPWFVIPDHVTVRRKDDIMKAGRQGSMCPTIMLTGLPEGNYRHEDVARLVWPYFPKQTLHSLYYNVTVLPLQRRAFVFFSDWTTCCDFVQAHVARRVSLKGCVLGVHFVLQNMYPESSEETMYRSLMKWSNAGVPDPTSLEERLLCVEVSEVSLDVITLVVEMVASITSFANFMPLANRICIEMTDSSCVTKVVERYNEFSPSSFTEDPAWRKVKHFEHLETFKRRLQDSAEVTINLDDPDAIVGKDESPEMDEDMLKAITVTVGESRLVQRSGSQRVEKKTQDDFADVLPQEQLNEDVVTVEEVSDDVKDSSVEPRCPSSPERSTSPSRQQTSTRSTTSSSGATENERSSSSRPENSSEPTKSSSQSPPAWSETPSSLDQNHPNGSSAPRLTGSKGGRVVVTIEAEGPLQERETVTKDGAATSQEDGGLVQRDGSTLKQLSEEGSGPASGQSEDNPADEADAGKKGESRDDSKQINASSKSTSEVISSVEDRPTDSETENKQPTSKRGEDVARGSDPTKEEEVSPRKADRTKRYETRQRTSATAGKELMESSGERSGRRRSGRGKREDEVKERVITTRSTRGKTARNPEEASTEKTKGKGTPTRGSVKKRGVSQEDQSEDGKGCVRKQIQIGDDAGRESNEEPTRTTSRSEKRKLDDDADEVKEEESRTTPRTRGRPKKRARLTPVRKSSRRKEEPSSLEASSSPSADKDSSDRTLKVQRKVVSKKRSGAVGPEAKRSRSQSPSLPADFKRPGFKPDKPLSEEFVVPAFFCSLCSLFYQQGSTSEEPHCSSQTHLHNLQKHHEELQQKSAGSSSKS